MTKANISPKQIAISLWLADPNQIFTMQDIYNIRKTIWIEQLAGKTPIEAMLHELWKSNYVHEYQLDQQYHITHLFFAHPTSIELLKRYPDVVLMDCTYKTNRFHLPLLDIIGSTGLNNTFYIGFIFISGETEEDYSWALHAFTATF